MPERGFYYHYKHNPDKGIRDYAYELIQIGISSEDVSQSFAIYRPLYSDSVAYRNGRRVWVRPLEMFAEDVIKDGRNLGKRFTKITDPSVIAELVKVRTEMYS